MKPPTKADRPSITEARVREIAGRSQLCQDTHPDTKDQVYKDRADLLSYISQRRTVPSGEEILAAIDKATELYLADGTRFKRRELYIKEAIAGLMQAPALTEEDRRSIEKFQYVRRRYQDGKLRDDDTSWLMNTVGSLLDRLTGGGAS